VTADHSVYVISSAERSRRIRYVGRTDRIDIRLDWHGRNGNRLPGEDAVWITTRSLDLQFGLEYFLWLYLRPSRNKVAPVWDVEKGLRRHEVARRYLVKRRNDPHIGWIAERALSRYR
jgi:hypothetical protein